MYGNLGNEHNQSVIRDLNKDATHCKLLKNNPRACDDTPIGDGNRGVCPLNPYHPSNVAKRNKAIADNPPVVSKETAEYLEAIGTQTDALLEMGLSDITKITPAEFILGWHYRRLRHMKDAEVQAKLIISELAKAMDTKK